MSAEDFKWITILTMVVATGWYIPLLYKEKIAPAPAAWIIATIAMCLSWATYWETPNHSFVGNIGIITSTGSIIILTVFYLMLLWIRGKLRVSFTRFQYLSLALTLLILMFWKNPFYLEQVERAKMSFWALQAILILSYLVMIQKIVSIKKNPDSIVMWIIVGIASIFALQAAYISNDIFGIWNSKRAIASSLVIIPLMIAYDLKNGRWETKKH